MWINFNKVGNESCWLRAHHRELESNQRCPLGKHSPCKLRDKPCSWPRQSRLDRKCACNIRGPCHLLMALAWGFTAVQHQRLDDLAAVQWLPPLPGSLAAGLLMSVLIAGLGWKRRVPVRETSFQSREGRRWERMDELILFCSLVLIWPHLPSAGKSLSSCLLFPTLTLTVVLTPWRASATFLRTQEHRFLCQF